MADYKFDDPAKAYAEALRRIKQADENGATAPTGDYLWLCPTHYREYDPGLPVLPTSSGEKTT